MESGWWNEHNYTPHTSKEFITEKIALLSERGINAKFGVCVGVKYTDS